MQIEVEVKGQRIKRISSPGSVEGTLNYLTCHFTFDGAEWENTVKTAYFQNPASGEKYPKILADDGTCTVPWEALTDKGFVRFSVAGERENYRITTGIESFYNSETVYGGNPSEPPTPDQYDQLIALAEQTKEIAESVRSDADAGKFDGEPGKPGDPGKDGVSPAAKVEQTDDGAVITVTDATGATTAKLKNGKDGNPGQDATDEQVRTAVDAYMKENPIQGDTEDIIKLAIKNEASGAVPITITDSADIGVQDLEMQGWTEQAQYEGKNLFDADKAKQLSSWIGTGVYRHFDIQLKPNTTYALFVSQNNMQKGYKEEYDDNFALYLGESENTATSNEYFGNSLVTLEPLTFYTFTTTEAPYYINLYVNLWSEENLKIAFDELLVNMMLIEGSSVVPYEPYTGGQPSPNPDYPQEIVSAGKYDEATGKYQYEVKLTGKNLFDAEYFKTTNDWKQPEDMNGYPYIPIYIGKGNTITISTDGTPDEGLGFYCTVARTNKSTSGNVYTWLYHSTNTNLIKTNVSFGVIEDDYIYFALNSGHDNIENFLNAFTNFQIEISAQRTEYQPYKEQTVTLTSDRLLTKWDRLEKRNGVWGWVYKSAEIVLDGSETWTSYSAYNYNGFYSFNILPFHDNQRDGYSENAFVGAYSNERFAIWLGSHSSDLYVIHAPQYDADLPDLGLQNWKDWLSENPITILTYVDEETFVPLSESEQEALNALHTYYPTTMLSNDVGCEMTIKYIADTKAYIDSKIAAIQAAVVNRI